MGFQRGLQNPKKFALRVFLFLHVMLTLVTQTTSLTRLLIQVGKHVLKCPGQFDWLYSEQILDLANEIKAAPCLFKPDELESAVKELFAGQDELLLDNLTVVVMERRIGWDNVFMIRFYSDRGVTDPTLSSSATSQVEEIAT